MLFPYGKVTVFVSEPNLTKKLCMGGVRLLLVKHGACFSCLKLHGPPLKSWNVAAICYRHSNTSSCIAGQDQRSAAAIFSDVYE